MRTRDLILSGLDSLRRQKLRSALTTIGVAVGIASLVASVAVGVGVRRIIDDGFKKQNRLREITIYPSFGHATDELDGVPPDALRVDGEMTPERRDRVRKRLAREWRLSHLPPAAKPLTPRQLREFASWEHVIAAEPRLVQSALAVRAGLIVRTDSAGFRGDVENLRAFVEFGRPPTKDAADEVIVHEYLMYRWGIRNDDAILDALGSPIRLDFPGPEARRPESFLALFDADGSKLSEAEARAAARARELLPKAIDSLPMDAAEKAALLTAIGRKRLKDPAEKVYPPVTAGFKIVGVFRSPKGEADEALLSDGGLDGDVILPAQRASELFSRLPGRAERGYDWATITVDAEEHLKPVCQQLKAEGYNFFAIGMFLQTARKNVLLIGFTMDFVALVALAVAALGIVNTMFTAVLERTKEIGVLKAVGAKDRHILIMFLFEGALIGLLGGCLGLLVGWLVSFPGDNVALKLIKEQEPNMPSPETVFRYPWWLLVGAPAFAVVLTTAAGLLPARRAARVEPVVALRSE